MRIKRLVTGALFAAAVLTACTGDDAPTTPTAPGLRADAADHNVADHFKSVEAFTFEVESPCNGELIVFSAEAISQFTLVDTREHLDAGFALHREFQQHTRATGTGSETGATYTLNDIFHESFNSPNPTAPHATFSAHGTTHVTSDLPGLSFDIHFVFHGVVPSGKEFKVTTNVENVECRG